MSISLATIAALTAALGSGIGAAGSASANASARERLLDEHDMERARLNRLLARNYVDSPENAGLMRRVKDMARERYNQSRAVSRVAGGTDAHLAAMQMAGNDVVTRVGDAVAERSQAAKDAIEERKLASERSHSQQMFGLDQQKAQSIANAAGQMTKAAAGIMAAGAPGMFGLTQDDYENMAKANIDAVTEQSVNAQLENSLQETLDELKNIFK